MITERESLLERLRCQWPPSPWQKWEDGERFGFTESRVAWQMFLFPYRVREFRGYDKVTHDLDLGSTHWMRPGIWRVLRR